MENIIFFQFQDFNQLIGFCILNFLNINTRELKQKQNLISLGRGRF